MPSRGAFLLILSLLPICCFSLPAQENTIQCGNHLRVDPDSSGWNAVLTIRTEEDYNGIWIEMNFDQQLDTLTSSYGDVSRLNGSSFSILNVNGQVLQKALFDVVFLMTCDICTDPPLLKNLVMNGKILCFNTEIREKQTPILINKTNEINIDSKIEVSKLNDEAGNIQGNDDDITRNDTFATDNIIFKNDKTNIILPEIIAKTNKQNKTDDNDAPNADYVLSNETLIIGKVLNNNKSTVIDKVNQELKTIINTSKLNTDKVNLLNTTIKEDSLNKVASEKPGINKSKIELRKLDQSIMEKLLETKLDTDILKELADVESYYSVRNLEKALFKHHVYEKMSTSPDYVKMMN